MHDEPLTLALIVSQDCPRTLYEDGSGLYCIAVHCQEFWIHATVWHDDTLNKWQCTVHDWAYDVNDLTTNNLKETV